MKVDNRTASRIIVVSGPSGSGKTTIVEAACELEPSLQRVPTATTRARRPDEVDGESYLFMDEDEFSAREEEGHFLETACVHGNRYGTPKDAIDTFLEHGLTPICILDPAGAASVRAAYPGQTASIFIDASDQELRRRLEERVGAMDVDRRMADAPAFRTHLSEYDLVILTDEQSIPETVEDFLLMCTQEHPTAVQMDAESLSQSFLQKNRFLKTSPEPELQLP